jgi:uncharacterized surface protein with fasciclin (FAS1) repeats
MCRVGECEIISVRANEDPLDAQLAGQKVRDDASSIREGGGVEAIITMSLTDSRLGTLGLALTTAGLAGALQSEGPYTLFAPTDGAFARLPEGMLNGLLNDAEALRDVLLCHVVLGKVSASEVMRVRELIAASGAVLGVHLVASKVMINNAQMLIADLEAENGVIHIIDRVLLPNTQ